MSDEIPPLAVIRFECVLVPQDRLLELVITAVASPAEYDAPRVLPLVLDAQTARALIQTMEQGLARMGAPH